MGYSAKAIANYFLEKYGSHGITHLKIQKLVYLAHGWNYAFREDDLVSDEFADAWEYGPVFPSLYEEFKHRGGSPIMKLATELDFESFLGDSTDPHFETPRIDPNDEETSALLDRVWAKYGSMPAMSLSGLTHQENTPWHKTRREKGAVRNANISNDDIKEYHAHRAAELG